MCIEFILWEAENEFLCINCVKDSLNILRLQNRGVRYSKYQYSELMNLSYKIVVRVKINARRHRGGA